MVVERNVVLPVGTLFIIAAVFCVMIRTDGISNSVVCSNEIRIYICPSWFSDRKKEERVCCRGSRRRATAGWRSAPA